MSGRDFLDNSVRTACERLAHDLRFSRSPVRFAAGTASCTLKVKHRQAHPVFPTGPCVVVRPSAALPGEAVRAVLSSAHPAFPDTPVFVETAGAMIGAAPGGRLFAMETTQTPTFRFIADFAHFVFPGISDVVLKNTHRFALPFETPTKTAYCFQAPYYEDAFFEATLDGTEDLIFTPLAEMAVAFSAPTGNVPTYTAFLRTLPEMMAEARDRGIATARLSRRCLCPRTHRQHTKRPASGRPCSTARRASAAARTPASSPGTASSPATRTTPPPAATRCSTTGTATGTSVTSSAASSTAPASRTATSSRRRPSRALRRSSASSPRPGPHPQINRLLLLKDKTGDGDELPEVGFDLLPLSDRQAREVLCNDVRFFLSTHGAASFKDFQGWYDEACRRFNTAHPPPFRQRRVDVPRAELEDVFVANRTLRSYVNPPSGYFVAEELPVYVNLLEQLPVDEYVWSLLQTVIYSVPCVLLCENRLHHRPDPQRSLPPTRHSTASSSPTSRRTPPRSTASRRLASPSATSRNSLTAAARPSLKRSHPPLRVLTVPLTVRTTLSGGRAACWTPCSSSSSSPSTLPRERCCRTTWP